MELLAVEVTDGGVADFVQVVRQYLATQAHGNALGALCQQQGELHGQRHRLLVAAVVGEFPLRRLRVEDHVEGELRQSGLDVTAGGGIVARQDVTPVSLAVDEQVLLSQLHQRVLDGGVAVGVELHRVAHDVGHLVEASVVHALHGVHDAPLHGLEAVGDVRHGAFQDYVGCVVEEPTLVHLVQVVGDAFYLLYVVSHVVFKG